MTVFNFKTKKVGQNLSAPNSNDSIVGGTGNDSLLGSGGNDTMVGGSGDDTLNGGVGNDVIWGDAQGNGAGGEGNDVLYGEGGNDQIHGGNGNDTASGGVDNDTIWGDNGNDKLEGGDGNDLLYGGNQDDVLWGGNGRDTVSGDNGNDTLNGGGDSDVFVGGNGADVFVIRTTATTGVTDSPFAVGGAATTGAPNVWDIVTDFASGDKIDLSQLNSMLTGGGPASLVWLGVKTTDAQAGNQELQRAHGVWTDTTNTFLYADINGDGKADMKIQINGGFPLGLDNLIGVTAPQTSDLVVESDTGAVTEAGAAGDGNAAADGNVLTNDSDPDGDSLVVSKVNGNAGNVGVAVEGKYGSVEIDANGVWHYALNNDDKDTNSLRAGETATDVFTYTVSDGHGETGTARVTVTITGANDAASVGGNIHGSVTENGSPTTASGVVTVSDVDHEEAAFKSPEGLAGTYGTFTFNKSNGEWSYSLSGDKADKLAAGDVAHDTLTVVSRDGTAQETIDITIYGTNDEAKMGGDRTGNLWEDGEVTTAGGTLTVSDVDHDEAGFQTPGSLDGTYGSFTFDTTTGHWTYTLDPDKADSLAGGQVVHDTLTIQSTDGTAQKTIDVEVHGVNDEATIAGDTSGDVTEDGAPVTAGGTLSVSDVDHDEAGFKSPEDLEGEYGTFTFNTSTGQWTYTLDHDKADALADGEEAHDTLTVRSIDGSAEETIDVTVHGTNDEAAMGGDVGGDVTEDGSPTTAGGTLTVSDIDHEEAGFQTPAGLEGTYGTFTFNTETGAWTYTLDHDKADSLDADQIVHDTLTIKSTDGTAEQTIDVTIHGTADSVAGGGNTAPTAAAETGGTVTEDLGPSTVFGALANNVSDADGDTLTFSVGDGGAGTYGQLDLDSTTGEWTYTLNDADGDTDALADGQTVAETYVYTVNDGHGGATTQTLTVTIAGHTDEATSDPNDHDEYAGQTSVFTGSGNSGNDSLFGSSGDDLGAVLAGGSGNDTIYGAGGNDNINGGSNNDVLFGGSGDDTVQASTGDDTVYGGSGSDQVDGFSGNDVIFGAVGSDHLIGGSGNDTIAGDDGADQLEGGDHNDSLSGGGGNDTLIGGIGDDTLTGGPGADRFVFQDPVFDPNDTITDFTHGTDVLLFNVDVDTYDAATWVGGVLDASDFASINTGAAPDAGDGHHFIFDTGTGALWYDADGAGAGAAVQVATITAIGGLTADDFHSYL